MPLLAAGANPAGTLPPDRELAHPIVSGAAGPYPHVKLTLTRAPSDNMAGVFAGSLDVGDGRELVLEGPDEPPDFFLFEVQAVLFTPVDHDHTNGIVILYNSSQIGPRNGTDHKALVYKVTADAATRQPAIEGKLEGVKLAADARRILAAIRR